MKSILYEAEITDISSLPRHKLGFTHAYSFRQALRNLGIRYPYPPNVIEKVTNTVTKQAFTKDEWLEATRYDQRD